MGEVVCDVCGRKLDSRGLSGHMRTHQPKGGAVSKGSPSGTHKAEVEDGQDTGVISYPTPPDFDPHTSQGIMVKDGVATTIKKKKTVKKTVASKPASKPASSPASKPDPRGQRKSEQEHKQEWQGFFRD